MQDHIEIAQAGAAASAATKASYAASVGTTLGSAATAQWVGVLAGILIGLATFWANWYWRKREHEARRAHERKELALQKAELDIRAGERA